MLKWHYLTVRDDGGRDICPPFSSPPLGICHPRQKKCYAWGSPGEGGGELTDQLA